MEDSVERRVTVGNVAILVVTLLLVGAGTAIALHWQRLNALDESLLAAAHGRAHPDTARVVEVEHSQSPIDAWLSEKGDSRVPEDLARRARRTERPVYRDVEGNRMVVLPFEIRDEQYEHDDERGEVIRLAVAATPKPSIGETTGPFLLVYSVLAAIAALIAVFAQRRVIRRAFKPLERAREEAERVVGFDDEQRLTESGPVEIRSLLKAINDLLDRRDDAFEAQRRFTAEAAHELRTPVTTLLGELDVALREAKTAEEYRQALASMREEVDRLRRLVEALTALARIDTGQIEARRELVRAGEIADRAIQAEEAALEDAGNDVYLEIDEDPELQVHRSLLEIALGNLLRNAARHAPESEVVVRVRRDRDRAVFTIDDGGPGISPELRQHVFDRFSRGGEARREDSTGMGLGLPIAREVARRHGGDCTLAESPLGGLRVRLTLLIPPGQAE